MLAEHRAAIAAGLLLAVGGVAVYLPMEAISGRYTMPAVWGVDLLLAALFAAVLRVPAGAGRRGALVAVLAGLAVVFIANVGRQQKLTARLDLLWQALHRVEMTAPSHLALGWVSGDRPDQLNIEEGIHFAWHLQARGRGDVAIGPCDLAGQPLSRCELPPMVGAPRWLLVGGNESPGDGWTAAGTFASRYWFDRKGFSATLWTRVE